MAAAACAGVNLTDSISRGYSCEQAQLTQYLNKLFAIAVLSSCAAAALLGLLFFCRARASWRCRTTPALCLVACMMPAALAGAFVAAILSDHAGCWNQRLRPMHAIVDSAYNFAECSDSGTFSLGYIISCSSLVVAAICTLPLGAFLRNLTATAAAAGPVRCLVGWLLPIFAVVSGVGLAVLSATPSHMEGSETGLGLKSLSSDRPLRALQLIGSYVFFFASFLTVATFAVSACAFEAGSRAMVFALILSWVLIVGHIAHLGFYMFEVCDEVFPHGFGLDMCTSSVALAEWLLVLLQCVWVANLVFVSHRLGARKASAMETGMLGTIYAEDVSVCQSQRLSDAASVSRTSSLV